MREFELIDYTREELFQYIEYLEDKFEDPKYRSAYSILSENDLGIDIISQALADFNLQSRARFNPYSGRSFSYNWSISTPCTNFQWVEGF